MKRLSYMIFDADGEPVTSFPRASPREAWGMLRWNHNIGVEAVKARYEPLGCECWQVEIVKKRKVRSSRKGERDGKAT